jgi:hypothetical protein
VLSEEHRLWSQGGKTPALPRTTPNEGLEPTPSSVRYAPASGSSSGLAFGGSGTSACGN